MSFDNRVLSPIGSYTISSINAVHSVRKIRKEEKKESYSKEKAKQNSEDENEVTLINVPDKNQTLENLPKSYDIDLRNSILKTKDMPFKKKSDPNNPKMELHKKLNDAMNIDVNKDLKNIMDKIEILDNKK